MFLAVAAIDATEGDAEIAGRYLTEELVDEQPHFCTNTDAIALRDALLAHIDRSQVRPAFDDDMRALNDSLRERFGLAKAWVDAYLASDEKFASKRFLAVETATLHGVGCGSGSSSLGSVPSSSLASAIRRASRTATASVLFSPAWVWVRWAT